MRLNHYYKLIKSPAGILTLVADESYLLEVRWEKLSSQATLPLVENKSHPVLVEAEKQLAEYFENKRKTFTIPLRFNGTPFQQIVWQQLQKIPFATTQSYGELASKIGNPKASRAVGAANGKNPLSIIVPCHRVIGKSGDLTGFAGGIKTKAHLLKLETQAINGSR